MTPEYQKSFQKGLEYQDFVTRQLLAEGIPLVGYNSFKYQVEIGENANGFEIKFDGRMRQTGLVFFETAEKSDPNNTAFVPSGIFRNDNTWIYVIGDYSVIYLCGKLHLRRLYEHERERNSGLVTFRETPTSQGMVVPQQYVEEKLALKIIRIGRP